MCMVLISIALLTRNAHIRRKMIVYNEPEARRGAVLCKGTSIRLKQIYLWYDVLVKQ